jgi:hypothetical protein
MLLFGFVKHSKQCEMTAILHPIRSKLVNQIGQYGQSYATQVRQQAVELVGSAYASLYAAVLDPSNNYPSPTELVPRTPEQVKTLLA